ncbi:hypothetical protein MLPF_0482 [Mycobacterium lepromatosis]|nr:hypothetical protein MLPF_0482 [Mycobacterium lepromatosis]
MASDHSPDSPHLSDVFADRAHIDIDVAVLSSRRIITSEACNVHFYTAPGRPSCMHNMRCSAYCRRTSAIQAPRHSAGHCCVARCDALGECLAWRQQDVVIISSIRRPGNGQHQKLRSTMVGNAIVALPDRHRPARWRCVARFVRASVDCRTVRSTLSVFSDTTLRTCQRDRVCP